MGDCEFSIIRESNFRKRGDATSFKVLPDIRYPCSAKFSFNNQPLNQHVGKDIGDIHVTGISSGHVSVRALSDNPSGQLIVEVMCKGEEPCGPTTKFIEFSGLASESDTIIIADLESRDVKRILEFIRRLLLFPFWGPVWLIVRIVFGEEAGDWIREHNFPFWKN